MNNSGARLEAVRADVAAAGLDGLLVSEPGNRRWLTGFTGSTGWPVVLAQDAFLLTDSRYYEQVEQQSGPVFRLEKAPARPMESLAAVLSEAGVLRMGVERDVMTLGQLESLRAKAPSIEWVPTSGLVEKHRAIKTPEEVEAIRAAVKLGDNAMELAYSSAAPGMTEAELAWRLERFMRENGAEAMAFDVIVAAGENGSLPHHSPSMRPIRAGEPIVIDLGARLNGYNSDLTRTFCIGAAADPDYAKVYALVDRANLAAAQGIRAGMLCRQADELAREVIRGAGYGDFFGHGLGHGVGLNVHEFPRLGPAAEEERLAESMVVTIEPGIYLPGRFGVRIEDLAVVRADHVQVLSQAPKCPEVALK
jgi:Xaa-Pro aminopeptidase